MAQNPSSPYGAVLSAVQAGVAAWGQAEVGAAQADAARMQNQANASASGLRSFIQALNNRRLRRQAQYATSDLAIQQQQQREQLTGQGFQQSIRQAEQTGATIAAGASSRMGSNAADAVAASTEIRQAASREALERAKGALAHDQEVAAVNLASQIESGQDFTQIRAQQRSVVGGGDSFLSGILGAVGTGLPWFADRIYKVQQDKAPPPETGWNSGYDLDPNR